MLLTKHKTTEGSRWAVEDSFLPPSFNLGTLLELPRPAMFQLLKTIPRGEQALEAEAAPIDPSQEVWAAGVTYYRSRTARLEESKVGGGASFYDRVYEAERPELFFKAAPWRVRSGRWWGTRARSTATRSQTRRELCGVT